MQSLDLANGSLVDNVFWLTLHGVNRLLSDFGYTVPERIALYSRLQSALAREFEIPNTRKHFSALFRRHRKTVENALDVPSFLPEPTRSCAETAFQHRSAAVGRIADDLRTLQASGNLTMPLESVVAAFIHMHVNRMARSAARRQELAIYHLLMRVYEASLACGQ